MSASADGIPLTRALVVALGGRPLSPADEDGVLVVERWHVRLSFTPTPAGRWAVRVGYLSGQTGVAGWGYAVEQAATLADVLACVFHAGVHAGGDRLRGELWRLLGDRPPSLPG